MLRKSLAVLVILAALFSIAHAQAPSSVLSLKTGFNFVSFGSKPLLTPAQLKEQNPAITEVYNYNATSGSFLSAGEGTLASLNVGKGYIISANAPVQITVGGTDVPVIGNITLKNGFNLAGFSKAGETIKFSDLMKRSAVIKSMYKWNSTSGSFIQVLNSGAGEPVLVDGFDVTIKAGEAYFMSIVGDTIMNLDGANITIGGAVNPPVKSLVGITISKTSDVVLTGANYDLSAIIVEAKYSDNSVSAVTANAVWALDAGQAGTLAVKTYTAPAAAGKTDFTVSYNENGVLKTAPFSLTVNLNDQPPVVNGPVMDVNVASFAKKALIALNVSGVSEGGADEAAGTLPANVAALSPVSFAFSAPSRSMIKDLPNRSGANRAPGVPNYAKLTETVTNFTFKVNEGDTPVNVPATLKYGSAASKCLIYLADDMSENATDWNGVGQNFDNQIYQKMINAFGAPTDVDGNGKIVILYYGMVSDTTMGFFHSIDLSPGQANDMEIFYMNIKWGSGAGKPGFADPLNAEMIRTLSHEFQHMINHGQRVIINKLAAMDSWMDEGLAESAEQLVSGVPGADRLNTFKNDAANKLKNGTRALCVWGNDDEAYGLSYTFFQYLKNQSKGRETMFKDIYANAKGDYTAVEEVMKTQGEGKFANFADLLRGYRMANLINGDGIYGYGPDRTLNAIDGKPYFDFSASSAIQAPLSTAGIKLSPGGAVYVYPSQSDLQAFAPNGQGANINFVRINK